MRIGELAARVGVSTHVLRAWEKRYGLLRPVRSSARYRLYGPSDELRVRELLRLRGEGASTAEAAARVLSADRAAGLAARGDAAPGQPVAAEPLVADLLAAVTTLDEVEGHATLDTAIAALSLESLITDVVLPFLGELGAQWETGALTVAHEHFASNLVRRRLSALSLTWGAGTGPVAVLACPAGEQHDLALMCFGLLLGQAGWRVRYLGPDTPVPALASATRIIDADVVVLASRRASSLLAYWRGLARLAADYPVCLAGPGADSELAGEIGATLLPTDLIEAVAVTAQAARAPRADAALTVGRDHGWPSAETGADRRQRPRLTLGRTTERAGALPAQL